MPAVQKKTDAKQHLRFKEKVETAAVNIVDEGSIKALFEKTGDFHDLATPGSEAPVGPFLKLDTKSAKMGFDSKFWGQYHAARYGAPRILPGGSITFFAGLWSQRPVPGSSVVTAINSATGGLGRALALELAPIRVNTISPGITDTPIYSGMPVREKEALFRKVATSIPAKRVGKPEDLAQAFVYSSRSV